MKITATHSLLMAVLLAGFAPRANAIQVTYSVDMSVQIALGRFNPATDTVFAFGNFSDPAFLQTATDGSTNYILVASANPNIYTNTFTLMTNAPGDFENHQFVINPGGAFTSLIYEPDINGGTGGNRFFVVPTVNTNLPTVFFDDVTNVNQQVAAQVTFYVNMSVQNTLGNFNPATDFVIVAGDWMGGNWAAALNSAPSMTPTGTNALVYQGTINISNTIGNLENYKFVIQSFNLGTIWEGNVGPGGGQNRQFNFPGLATNIPAVYFNDASNANVSVQVSFNVDAIVQDAQGTFTPGDAVYVAGEFNNWSTTATPMTPSLSDPNMFSATATVAGRSPGTTVNYKYVVSDPLMGNGGWELNGVGPNGAQNRQLIVPNIASTNIPLDYYNNVTNLGIITISNSTGQARIKWPISGTRIRLQNSSNLNSPAAWADVPNTLGSNSATLNASGKQLYRVKGP